MKQFQRKIDGFYDVENQLPRYLREMADTQFEQAHIERQQIDSRQAALENREQKREYFLDAIGGLPEERCELRSNQTGQLKRNGYDIEKIIFESLPGFHVTANLYRPHSKTDDKTETYPGILFLCGHSNNGKGSRVYQQVCIDLVRSGFVVLSVDPVGQGERHQFYDPDTGDLSRQNTTEHTYLNQQCAFAGANVARYMIWDGIRAIDYLETRPEVDSSRIGVTGNSGGGLQTSYLMLVDERIDAAVPCCFITSKEEYMKTGQGQDGEQILYRAIDRGPRYDDFLSAFAPKPVLVGAAQSDFLCIEGTLRSVERARSIYECFECPEAIDIMIADQTHGFGPQLREGAVNWFKEYLQGSAPNFQTNDPKTDSPEALWCTSTGEVRAEFANETTVTDLIREYIAIQKPDAATTPDKANWDQYTSEMRERVIQRFELDRHRDSLYPRQYDAETIDGVTWEKVFFPSEYDPTIVVTGIVAYTEDTKINNIDNPLLLLYEHGTNSIDDHVAEIRDRVANHGFVLVFDPRGIGAVRPRDVNTSLMNGGGYNDYHGTKDKLTSDAIMLGTSLIAMQVFDICQSCEYLQSRITDTIEIAVEAHGTMTIHALLSAIATPSLRTLTLLDPRPSFYELATSREIDIDHGQTMHGVIGTFDIPQLLPALSDREIHWKGGNPERYR